MAVEVAFRTPTLEDISRLAERMRDLDAQEIWSMGGETPLESVRRSVAGSQEAWTVLFDGDVAAIFGVAPSGLMPGAGVVWLLTTKLVDRHPTTFYRTCQKMLPMLLDRFPILYNAILDRYTRAVRWAGRLGFSLSEPEPMGVHQEPFRVATITREDLTWVPSL